MDFTKHDARTAAETPIEVKLRDPATGDFYMDGDEHCSVMVVGIGARSVQAAELAEARAKFVGGKRASKKEEAMAGETIHRMLNDAAAKLIRGFKNIENGDSPLTTSKEDIQWFLDRTFISIRYLNWEHDNPGQDDGMWRNPSFAQQILTAASNSALYLGE